MSLIDSFYWHGPSDPTTLNEIIQTGATAIVSALDQIPVGEVWEYDDIKERIDYIQQNSNGLCSWKVVECLPVHDSIKLGLPNRDKYISNFIESLTNLSKCDINCVTYHTMPLLDWVRTDLKTLYSDGSFATSFNYLDFAIFELFVLKHDDESINQSAVHRYSEDIIKIAFTKYNEQMSDLQINNLRNTCIGGMPGSANQVYSVQDFKKVLEYYQMITKNEMQQNVSYFLQTVIPHCVDLDMNLALHPDDPPISDLLGIPRIACDYEDIDFLLNGIEGCNVINNGLELCVASLAAKYDNDVYRITADFAGRTHSVHLRNIHTIPEYDSFGDSSLSDLRSSSYLKTGYSFVESNHLDGQIDILNVVSALLNKQDRDLWWRPDHGHLTLGDINNQNTIAGMPFYGRFKGLCEIRGVIKALSTMRTAIPRLH